MNAKVLTSLQALGLACIVGSAAAATSGIVVVETPRSPCAAVALNRVDLRYPPGSRVVFCTERVAGRRLRVLSDGLQAAGGPVLSYDGQTVFFSGKAVGESTWEIYEARLEAGHWRRVTSVPGGAVEPALLSDGSVVFASPAPVNGSAVSQLYAQTPSGQLRQLTFSPAGASDPTVLLDGRILFVSALASVSSGPVGLSLFTVNNDGTEITAFACQHDPPANLRRPRQLPDGRLAFVASGLERASAEATAEYVRMARPFQSRGKLLPNAAARICSVQPGGETNLLVCAEDAGSAWAVYRVPAGDEKLGPPLFEEAGWDCVEAVAAGPHQRPMGRITNMDPAKKTGQILCLDVNDTTYGEAEKPEKNVATRVRVLMEAAPGNCLSLGEVAVQTDGSFMAEIPADVVVGFEALNEQGQVLRRVGPAIWVRAGENRACVGCHAAHNRAPHNHRPLAVRVPVPRLGVESTPDSVQRTAAK
jgi:Hydrazine synthase alpha subunit middle domain